MKAETKVETKKVSKTKEVLIDDLQQLLQDSILMEKAIRQAHTSGAFPNMEDTVNLYGALQRLGAFNGKYTVEPVQAKSNGKE